MPGRIFGPGIWFCQTILLSKFSSGAWECVPSPRAFASQASTLFLSYILWASGNSFFIISVWFKIPLSSGNQKLDVRLKLLSKTCHHFVRHNSYTDLILAALSLAVGVPILPEPTSSGLITLSLQLSHGSQGSSLSHLPGPVHRLLPLGLHSRELKSMLCPLVSLVSPSPAALSSTALPVSFQCTNPAFCSGFLARSPSYFLNNMYVLVQITILLWWNTKTKNNLGRKRFVWLT